jgi:hypothetical protein
MSHSLPTIAIHGVGRHEPGVIEKRVGDTVGRDGGFDLTVAEFNWDQSVDHRVVADPQEAFENLQRVCVTLHGTAAARSWSGARASTRTFHSSSSPAAACFA